MKLKPIEPGCKAIVIGQDKGQNGGKQVLVELLIPADGQFSDGFMSYTNHSAKAGKRVWKVAAPSLNVQVDGKIINIGWATIKEQHLMRIDGDDFLDEENPYKEKERTNERS